MIRNGAAQSNQSVFLRTNIINRQESKSLYEKMLFTYMLPEGPPVCLRKSKHDS